MLDRSFLVMGIADEHPNGAGKRDAQDWRFAFPGDETSVRAALASAIGALRHCGLAEQALHTVEIALAEVLNNVVEHAGASRDLGAIVLNIAWQGDMLTVEVTDDGAPMPQEELPDGTPHDLDVPSESLPEGGFGWLLIRMLTEELSYRRAAGRNELRFRVPL